MDRKQFSRRILGVVTVLALVLIVMISTLYEAQMVDGANYLKQSNVKITATETVSAARGQILDRYGRVLVSDRASYEVLLDDAIMGDNRNQIIADLIAISEDEGVVWMDTLAISQGENSVFTTDTPYYGTYIDEDDEPYRVLSRLGRLSLAMHWIEKDPTIPDNYDVPLPTAAELLDKMCVSFELADRDMETDLETGDIISEEIIYTDHTRAEARKLAGVRYEMALRTKDIYWMPYVFAEDVDITFISKVKESNLHGIDINSTAVREYSTDYAAHLLGRVTIENEKAVGKEGLEKVFDPYLQSTDGLRAVEHNEFGTVVNESWITEPKPGNNVVLTVDIDLQKKVEDSLKDGLPQLESQEVQGAACVVIDVDSGDVLAMASYPTFSLDTYSEDFKTNSVDPLKPLYNRATLGTYAPGSTFKMVVGVAALEEGIVTPQPEIYDEGVYRYYIENGPMCWSYRQYGYVHGNQNVSEAIKNSCNYYFYEIGRLLGIQRIGRYAEMFGLAQPTGIELPETVGIMAGPAYNESLDLPWYDGSTLSVAIGQESSQFTPLQMANYVATLVNGGTHYSVTLLNEIRSSDFSEVLFSEPPEIRNEIDIKNENLEAVKVGMLELTETGDGARYYKDFDIKVGAKTGTAQVSPDKESNATYVCFAPYDDPEIALALVVEQGGGGGDLSKMVVDILDYYFSAQESRNEVVPENTLIR